MPPSIPSQGIKALLRPSHLCSYWRCRFGCRTGGPRPVRLCAPSEQEPELEQTSIIRPAPPCRSAGSDQRAFSSRLWWRRRRRRHAGGWRPLGPSGRGNSLGRDAERRCACANAGPQPGAHSRSEPGAHSCTHAGSDPGPNAGTVWPSSDQCFRQSRPEPDVHHERPVPGGPA